MIFFSNFISLLYPFQGYYSKYSDTANTPAKDIKNFLYYDLKFQAKKNQKYAIPYYFCRFTVEMDIWFNCFNIHAKMLF